MPDIDIPNALAAIRYVADGATSDFVFPFPTFTADDLAVYVGTVRQTRGVHYTVAGAGTTGGGTVTFLAPLPPDGALITLRREIIPQRVTDFPASGTLTSDGLNRELDVLTALAQDLHARQDRTIELPVDEATPAGVFIFPPLADRAGKALGFDMAGLPVPVDPGSGGGPGVTDHGSLTGLADDDHPHYLTAARGDARYPPAVHVHDHGSLTGLADDDHTQYLNAARGNALYSPLGHSHPGSGGPPNIVDLKAEGLVLDGVADDGPALNALIAYYADPARRNGVLFTKPPQYARLATSVPILINTHLIGFDCGPLGGFGGNPSEVTSAPTAGLQIDYIGDVNPAAAVIDIVSVPGFAASGILLRGLRVNAASKAGYAIRARSARAIGFDCVTLNGTVAGVYLGCLDTLTGVHLATQDCYGNIWIYQSDDALSGDGIVFDGVQDPAVSGNASFNNFWTIQGAISRGDFCKFKASDNNHIYMLRGWRHGSVRTPSETQDRFLVFEGTNSATKPTHSRFNVVHKLSHSKLAGYTVFEGTAKWSYKGADSCGILGLDQDNGTPIPITQYGATNCYAFAANRRLASRPAPVAGAFQLSAGGTYELTLTAAATPITINNSLQNVQTAVETFVRVKQDAAGNRTIATPTVTLGTFQWLGPAPTLNSGSGAETLLKFVSMRPPLAEDIPAHMTDNGTRTFGWMEQSPLAGTPVLVTPQSSPTILDVGPPTDWTVAPNTWVEVTLSGTDHEIRIDQSTQPVTTYMVAYVLVKQDGTGGRTVKGTDGIYGWNGSATLPVYWDGGTQPAVPTAPNGWAFLQFDLRRYADGTRRIQARVVASSAGAAGSGTTNLDIANRDVDSLDVTSSTGTDVTLPAATTTQAGLLTGTDKLKLDGVEAGATLAGAAGDAFAATHAGSGAAHTAANITALPYSHVAGATVQAFLEELTDEKRLLRQAVVAPTGTGTPKVFTVSPAMGFAEVTLDAADCQIVLDNGAGHIATNESAELLLLVQQDGSGSRALSAVTVSSGTLLWDQGAAPTWPTGANSWTLLHCTTRATAANRRTIIRVLASGAQRSEIYWDIAAEITRSGSAPHWLIPGSGYTEITLTASGDTIRFDLSQVPQKGHGRTILKVIQGSGAPHTVGAWEVSAGTLIGETPELLTAVNDWDLFELVHRRKNDGTRVAHMRWLEGKAS